MVVDIQPRDSLPPVVCVGLVGICSTSISNSGSLVDAVACLTYSNFGVPSVSTVNSSKALMSMQMGLLVGVSRSKFS